MRGEKHHNQWCVGALAPTSLALQQRRGEGRERREREREPSRKEVHASSRGASKQVFMGGLIVYNLLAARRSASVYGKTASSMRDGWGCLAWRPSLAFFASWVLSVASLAAGAGGSQLMRELLPSGAYCISHASFWFEFRLRSSGFGQRNYTPRGVGNSVPLVLLCISAGRSLPPVFKTHHKPITEKSKAGAWPAYRPIFGVPVLVYAPLPLRQRSARTGPQLGSTWQRMLPRATTCSTCRGEARRSRAHTTRRHAPPRRPNACLCIFRNMKSSLPAACFRATRGICTAPSIECSFRTAAWTCLYWTRSQPMESCNSAGGIS